MEIRYNASKITGCKESSEMHERYIYIYIHMYKGGGLVIEIIVILRCYVLSKGL